MPGRQNSTACLARCLLRGATHCSHSAPTIKAKKQQQQQQAAPHLLVLVGQLRLLLIWQMRLQVKQRQRLWLWLQMRRPLRLRCMRWTALQRCPHCFYAWPLSLVARSCHPTHWRQAGSTWSAPQHSACCMIWWWRHRPTQRRPPPRPVGALPQQQLLMGPRIVASSRRHTALCLRLMRPQPGAPGPRFLLARQLQRGRLSSPCPCSRTAATRPALLLLSSAQQQLHRCFCCSVLPMTR